MVNVLMKCRQLGIPKRQLLQLTGVTRMQPRHPRKTSLLAQGPGSRVTGVAAPSCGEFSPTHHFFGLAGPRLILSTSRLLEAHRK